MNAPLRPPSVDAADRLTAYRPFIDGLRAVSILSVVAFHVGVPGFSGGFVGVDVFFVISGFLIIGQIIESLDAGRFSFADFWARRALRILPPYLLVLVVAALFAPGILVMPADLDDFGRQVAYSAAMIVNHLFMLQQGYFDGPAETKVLLNLWSLSVEEQFYLFTPPLLAGLYWLIRRSRNPHARTLILGWSTAAIFLVSLVLCVAFTAGPASRNPGFYLMPLRAWEFVAGGALGLMLPLAQRLPAAARATLAPAGLLAILVSVFAFSADLHYPSVYALLPAIGAAAVILGGLLRPSGPAVRLLAAPPMVAIGLVSYSWYLWHWPMLTYGRILNFGERHLPADLAVALISLGLAGLTYLLLERPIRRLRQAGRIRPGWRPVAAGAAACAAVAALGGFGFAELARGSSVPPQYLPVASAARPVCDLQVVSSAGDCLALASGRPTGLLIGDSQALGPRDSIVSAAEAAGNFLVSYASAGCVAVTGAKIFVNDAAMQANCAAMRKTGPGVLAGMAAAGAPPRFALLYSRWHLYHDGLGNAALGEPGADQPAPDQPAFFAAALRRTIEDLQAIGVERVLVLGPTPVFRRVAPTCLALADRYAASRDTACGISRSSADAARAASERLIAQALKGLPGVRYVDPTGDFCDAQICRSWTDDAILMVDANHLGNAGMDHILAAHRDDFAWLFDAAH